MALRQNDAMGSSRDYKRGAIMGLTVAEAFILLTFVLLLLFTWWQADAEKKSLEAARILGDMSDAQKKEVIAGLADGTYEMAKELREAGLKPGDSAAIADTANYSRFMREEDLQRLLKGAVELSPDTKLTLADAVEITPDMRLRAALQEAMSPEDGLAQVNKRLAAAAAEQERVVGMLDAELGEKIRAAGGAIAADGTITLPQNILFDVGSSQIRNPTFLREFCTPWIRTLQGSGMDISDLKIEGHASSEGMGKQTPEQAYLYNLGLSQERAQNALKTCLGGLKDPAILAWARDHLSSTGYSSARLVRNAEGSEDKDASRRVMFSMEMNREQLIEDIREDLGATGAGGARLLGNEKPALRVEAAAESAVVGEAIHPPRRAAPILSSVVPGHDGHAARVIDGDTLAIGDQRWRILGIDAPEIKQSCRKADGSGFACGAAARDALVDLIGNSGVTCDQTDTDRYGRAVGICRAGGRDLGLQLVAMGMAVPYLQYSDSYRVQGEAARAAKLGLWSGDFEMPHEFRKLN
ncbi:thermonuclease family protein [Paracoccus sp. PAR01]|uniref:thermonuclease family protein n=1 Tax=Paracoccus sp. PAR01 TaxID=2769282 RepID=UPI00177D213D|nr:thermonuclease family protein [Paracoccus sp. PAR01]MBD9529703.1 thermonuclease family protein [Paracoccus sp. PAR01]